MNIYGVICNPREYDLILKERDIADNRGWPLFVVAAHAKHPPEYFTSFESRDAFNRALKALDDEK